MTQFIKQSADGEILLSKSAVVTLLAATALQSFEKIPRKRATAALNLLLSAAIQRGYRGSDELKRCFQNPNIDRKEERRLAGELAEYLNADDIQLAFRYVNETL